jgi:N-6 DNA Methylase
MFFKQYLLSLGIKDFDGKSNFYRYDIVLKSDNHINNIPIEFYFIPKTFLFEDSVYDIHDSVWNKNDTPNFIIVSEEKSYIFDSKVKPKKDNPFYAEIGSFKHNNSFDNDNPILKKNLDSGYFFEFVIQKTKKNKQQEVDKDLLLNLIALRQDLLDVKNDETTIHLLILRSLFLKYLEDRGIYEKGYVVSALSLSADALIAAFNEVGRINGDIFKYDVLTADQISANYLSSIARFFTCDYRTGQGSFFPYKFDCIPVQLISNVYEAFLSDSKKKVKGIYYTPKFVVDFMLSETLQPLLKSNPNITLFDPACGSAAFLVEGFKAIIVRNKAQKNFEKKKEILRNQIFGIDIDKDALQIAAFSLYLTLLEDLEPDFIRYQIEKQSPILPNLIGKNLLCGNSLTDNELFKDKKFDCIVANPPWLSVKDDIENTQAIEVRQAIGDSTIKGTVPEYKTVGDYQLSQAFILRVERWSQSDTIFGLIVNNSNFFNQKSIAFRKELLTKYKLKTFYEFSKLNKILFKKTDIGIIKGKKIQVGATEPCAFLVFENIDNKENIINYIVPKLTLLSEALNLIQITHRDIKKVKQSVLVDISDEIIKKLQKGIITEVTNDAIWKIFVNGEWEDFELIKMLSQKKDYSFAIDCKKGFEPKQNSIPSINPDNKKIIFSENIERFYVSDILSDFDWNQEKRARGGGLKLSAYQGERLLIAYRPKPSDNFRLRCCYTNQEVIHKTDVVSFRTNYNQHYKPILGILNSSLIGYYLFNISSQWQGSLKREVARLNEIKSLPIKLLNENTDTMNTIANLVIHIENSKKQYQDTTEIERKLDDIVFDLYGLLTFEKEIIREFYDINVHRKNDFVREGDIKAYFLKFKEVFELALSTELEMKAIFKISKNLGAYLCLSIIPKNTNTSEVFALSNISDDEVFHAMKSQQLEQAYNSNKLNEIATKVYENERFFIIKSNYFKDWTVRQAIKDANEEIKTFIQETTTID